MEPHLNTLVHLRNILQPPQLAGLQALSLQYKTHVVFKPKVLIIWFFRDTHAQGLALGAVLLAPLKSQEAGSPNSEGQTNHKFGAIYHILSLRLKIAQKPHIVWSLGPKALKYESLEPHPVIILL